MSDTSELVNAKIGLIFGVAVITFLASVLPWGIVSKFAVAVELLPVGMCLAAGIILGSAISHLFPDSIDTWNEYFATKQEENDYPFASLLIGFTLLALICVDRLVIGRGMSGADSDGHSHMAVELPEDFKEQQQHKKDLELKELNTKRQTQDSSPSTFKTDIKPKGDATPTTEDKTGETQDTQARHTNSKANRKSKKKKKKEEPNKPDEKETLHEEVKQLKAQLERQHTLQKWRQETELKLVENMKKAKEEKQIKKARSQAVIFFFALSLHSIFDGLGVGAEADTSSFYGLLIAILAHKLLDGFALGVPLYFAKWPFPQTVAALIFSALMTPMGIGIGMAITETQNGADGLLSRAIILSISCGSMIFIALLELLPTGLEHNSWIKVKLAATVAGWALMVIIAIWV